MTRGLRLSALLILIFGFCVATSRAQQSPQPEREQARKQLKLIADHLAGQILNQPWIEWPDVEPKQLIEYLKQLDAADQLRLEAIALARKYAVPVELIKKPDQGPGYHHLVRDRLRFAWRVLMETDVLRTGMSLEEAVAILGLPDMVYGNKEAANNIVDWSYESIMHVNPALRCSFRGGVLQKIEVINK